MEDEGISIWKQKRLPKTGVNYLRASGLCFYGVDCWQEDGRTPICQTTSGFGDEKPKHSPTLRERLVHDVCTIDLSSCFQFQLEYCVSRHKADANFLLDVLLNSQITEVRDIHPLALGGVTVLIGALLP